MITADAVAERLFTAVEFARMCEVGVFGTDESIELIDGRILVMPPQGPLHASTARLLLKMLLAQGFSLDEVLHENPVLLGKDSECVPDLVLVDPDPEDPLFRREHPTPENIRLIVEVSDSTLAFDRLVKAKTYAAAGIRKYWVVDLNGRRLITHSNPIRGEYNDVEVLLWGGGHRAAILGGGFLDIDALFTD